MTGGESFAPDFVLWEDKMYVVWSERERVSDFDYNWEIYFEELQVEGN